MAQARGLRPRSGGDLNELHLMLAQASPADGLTVGWAVIVSCAAVLVAILGGVIQVASRIGVMTQTLADMREQFRAQLGKHDGLSEDVRENTLAIGVIRSEVSQARKDIDALWTKRRSE